MNDSKAVENVLKFIFMTKKFDPVEDFQHNAGYQNKGLTNLILREE